VEVQRALIDQIRAGNSGVCGCVVLVPRWHHVHPFPSGRRHRACPFGTPSDLDGVWPGSFLTLAPTCQLGLESDRYPERSENPGELRPQVRDCEGMVSTDNFKNNEEHARWL